MKISKVVTLIINIILILNMAVANIVVRADNGGAIFPVIDSGMIETELIPVISKGHPFIVADNDNFNRVRENAFGKDEIITKQYKLIKEKATALLDEPLLRVTYDISSNSYIGTAVEFWNNIMNLAFVWQIEKEECYAERAWEQALIFCEMENWGKYQMIDNVQTAFGVTLCYDWLYDWLNDSQKKILVDSLKEKHFDEILDLYENPDKPEYRWSFHQAVFAGNNHGIMTNTLTFLGAMAIAELNMDYSVRIMEHSLKVLENPLARWYPDSAWYEGLGYWSYTAPYMAKLFATMKNSFGNCMGYEDIPYLMNVSDFPIYAQSSDGSFVWNDTTLSVDMRIPVIYTFGVLKNDVALQRFALENTPIDTVADAEFCLMYNPDMNYDDDFHPSLDKFFRSTDLVTMRNTFSGGQETWCAMAVQKAAVSSGMMNSGTVSLDALGERWIMNHGKEEYYDGYWDANTRWTWYRTRAEANSCLVINPSEYGGQNMTAEDVINTFVSGDGSSYAISDLTETYLGQVTSYKRGVSLENGRRTFVVQDELSMAENSDVYSFFNIYKSDIEIMPDGKSAVISKGHKKLYVEVYSDQRFTFSVMDCVPLPTSPLPAYPNSDNSDFKKLAVFFDNIKSANIRVSFTPYLSEEEIDSVKGKPFESLANWRVENATYIPELSDIRLNGKTIDGFNPKKRYYEIVSKSDSVSLTISANKDLYNVKSEYDSKDKLYKITVSDKNNPSIANCYMVDLSCETLVVTPTVTYTHSSFKGVMMPQEFHRLEKNNNFGVWYVKDNAPANTKRAVLTLYAKPEGASVNTTLNVCSVLWGNNLGDLSHANSPIDPRKDLNVELTSSVASASGNEFVKIEYDITSLVPKDGGEYTIAFLPKYSDTDFLTVASHLNSDKSIRPKIQYLYK